MKFVFRWFGEGFDPVPLNYIKQIPGISGVVSMLCDIPSGEVWPKEKILSMKEGITKHGLSMEVIESVNVHESIKLGAPNRDLYIGNYIKTIRNLGQAGVKVICYNFMPIFDWIRTELSHTLPDGSQALYYNSAFVNGPSPEEFAAEFTKHSNGFSLPGWEPERLALLKPVFEQYKSLDEDDLWRNLEYFLKAIVPEAERVGIKMAIHPDDPPWSIFGLLRIMKNEKDLERLTSLVNSPSNGIALCSGALGADARNDIPAMIRRFGGAGRIPFAHVRNVMRSAGKVDTSVFYDAPHPTDMGSLDMYQIMRAYSDIGFDGYIRPDHGRMVWGEDGRPGYGFYDRALGVMYLFGLWEALLNERRR